jgi:hypothetical protein
MRKLIVALALAMALASPAFAQSYNPDVGSGNIVPYAGVQAPQSNADNAYAQVKPRGPAAQHVNRGAHARGAAHAPQAAFGRVTSSDASAADAGSREQALRECSALAAPYRQNTWGNMDIHQFRSCMMQHGQTE